jgi:hypothetical protein
VATWLEAHDARTLELRADLEPPALEAFLSAA